MKKLLFTGLFIALAIQGFSQQQEGSENPTQTATPAQADLPNGLNTSQSTREPVVRMYPNPAGTSITIEGFVVNAKPNYELIDPTGRTVLTGVATAESQRVDLSNIPSGMYIVKITTPGQQPVTLRLVKQ